MKMSATRQREEVLAILRASLSGLNLPMDLVDDLIERHIAVVFEKGAMAFCEGNTDGMLACILSGYVYVYCPVGDGNRTLLRIAGPGEIIGYADCVDEKGRNARLFEAQVASKCTLALFTRDHIARLLAGLSPKTLISIGLSLNTFWSKKVQFFATLLNLPLWDRLTIVLSDLAKRVGVIDSAGTILLPDIVHDDLAEMIGCSRPMVSRLMAQMIDARLIARRGKQFVLLKNWDLNRKGRSTKKAVRRLQIVAPGRSAIFAAGSANRGISTYSTSRPAEQ